ncbi:hypothetical protein LTR53_002462 [Teratosphaeriaceae sp. CCFEE 6253]|nr:hypothetical protein LTR53_002462 [Teratosphaeriaceae sp. CCFEE 6253]
MVHLSLQHRVKPGRQATLLSETSSDGPHTALLGLSAAIAAFNVLFFIAGAVMAGLIDYSWSGDFHRDGRIHAQKAKLVFFYCTIPFAFSALGIYATLKHRRAASLTLAIASGALGLVMWCTQIGLQGKCIFANGAVNVLVFPQPSPGFCAFSLTEHWNPLDFWHTGLGVVDAMTWTSVLIPVLSVLRPLTLIHTHTLTTYRRYAAYLTLAAALLLKHRAAAAEKPSRMPHGYAYHSAVEETEMHTDRDMPDRSGAPTPVPVEQTEGGRPPSYRSRAGSAFREDLPAEKEREIV